MKTPHFPTDMERMAERGAACGHFAIAAALGVDVREVMPFFPVGQSWCSVKTMQAALERTGWPFKKVAGEGKTCMALFFKSPAPSGIILIQGLGSWMKPGVPYGARLSRTHWVGIRENHVADANADKWLSTSEWQRLVMVRLQQQWKATGWEVKCGYTITREMPVPLARSDGTTTL